MLPVLQVVFFRRALHAAQFFTNWIVKRILAASCCCKTVVNCKCSGGAAWVLHLQTWRLWRLTDGQKTTATAVTTATTTATSTAASCHSTRFCLQQAICHFCGYAAYNCFSFPQRATWQPHCCCSSSCTREQQQQKPLVEHVLHSTRLASPATCKVKPLFHVFFHVRFVLFFFFFFLCLSCCCRYGCCVAYVGHFLRC